MWNAGYYVGLGFFCLLLGVWLWFWFIDKKFDRDEVLYFVQLHDSKVVMIVLLASGEEISVLGHGVVWRHLLKAEACSPELTLILEALWRREMEATPI